MRVTILALALAVSAVAYADPLALHKTQYEITPGQAIAISVADETRDFLRDATERKLSMKGFNVGPNRDRDKILLAASLAIRPGDYTMTISALSSSGERREAQVGVHVLTLTVPISMQPPVILINGWNPGSISCTLANGASDTFGSLATKLSSAGVPAVFFFDNCAACANCTIEELGAALATAIGQIEYTNGQLVPQIDLIGHSMGGLIARAYLAGLQDGAVLSPPIPTRIRKLIQIATPNFGSYLASQFPSTQNDEMIPGSVFLWNLARWNQGADDLRGVDALAIIGYAGTINGTETNASDGVVSLTSASIGFGVGVSANRTRLLPYCNTYPNVYMTCANTVPIADPDYAPETGEIILSFLANTTAWQSIGAAPDQDPAYLAQFGGLYFGVQNTQEQMVADITQVVFGNTYLTNGGLVDEIFYGDFFGGTGEFQFTSESLGTVNCGPQTAAIGYYSVWRCKYMPLISAVTPLLSGAPGMVVESGTTITIIGEGFGASKCNGCAVTANGTTLQTATWNNTTITASLPSTYNGLATLVVTTAGGGTDSLNILASPAGAPTATATGLVNAASFAASSGVSPGSIASLFGTLLAATATSASGSTLPTTLDGTQVQVTPSTGSAVSAPLFYVSPGQINFQMPFEVSGNVMMEVTAAGGSSSQVSLTLPAAAPGIFTVGSTGTGQGAILNQDFSANSASNPAAAGSVIMIYATGLGPVTPTLASGAPGSGTSPYNTTQLTPTVTVNGLPAVVQFSAMAPGFVGLYQVNVQLPTNLTAGNSLAVVMTVDGEQSNSVTIAVH